MAARRFAQPGPEARTADLVERAVACAKQGHVDAVHFLYVRFVDEVGAFVRGTVGDAEAESVTEAVFAKLVTEVQHYEPGALPFAGWILRLADRVVSTEGLAGDDSKHGRSPPLHDAFCRLPDDQRRVLVLRHIAGLSTTEIAQRLGKSEAAVRELHQNGSRALRAPRLDAAAASPE